MVAYNFANIYDSIASTAHFDQFWQFKNAKNMVIWNYIRSAPLELFLCKLREVIKLIFMK